MEKEVTGIDNDKEEVTKNISYRLQFIDCARFIANLSNIVDNFSE